MGQDPGGISMSGYGNNEVDFTGIATVKQFHERIRQGMQVPEYYGDNLDALYDVLSGMNGRVVFRGVENVDEDMVGYMNRFMTMCADAKSNPLVEIVMA